LDSTMRGGPIYPPGAAPGSPPQRFGRFLLLRQIALGGMAEIWLASDAPIAEPGGGKATAGRRDVLGRPPEGPHRPLVINGILPHYAANPDFVAFFLNEGRIATRLRHPHIIDTFQLGQIDGQYFLAMEYLRGDALIEALRRSAQWSRQLPLGFAVDV